MVAVALSYIKLQETVDEIVFPAMSVTGGKDGL
jgi:hypothetical protein